MKKTMARRLTSFCVCLALFLMSFSQVLSVNAQANEWTEDFENVTTLGETNYFSYGAAGITDNGFDGKAAEIELFGGLTRTLNLNPEKAILKAGIAYEISADIRWTADASSTSDKWGIWVATADTSTELGYHEFFPSNGAGGWASDTDPVWIGYSSTVLSDRITVNFKLTPTQNAVFQLWACDGCIGKVIIDNVKIIGSELITYDLLLNEEFTTAASLNDTVYFSDCNASVIDNGIDGNSAEIVAAGGAFRALNLNPEKAMLKAGVVYKISADISWTADASSASDKWGFWVATADTLTEIGYHEFFPSDGSGGWASTSDPVQIIYSSTVLSDRITVNFTLTPTQNAVFQLWACDGTRGKAIIDNVKIAGSELITYNLIHSEDFTTAASLNDTVYFSNCNAAVISDGIDGNSAAIEVASSAGAFRVLNLNPEKAMLKAGVAYKISADIRWIADEASPSDKWGFWVATADTLTEIGYHEFFPSNGSDGWASTSDPVWIGYNSTVLSDRTTVNFTLTPTQNAVFQLWACDGLGTAIIDNVKIYGSELITIEELNRESFNYASSLSDTLYSTEGTASIVENAITGESLSITTSGDYQTVFMLNDERAELKAGFSYKISLDLLWSNDRADDSSKWGVWVKNQDGTLIGYREFFASDGAASWNDTSLPVIIDYNYSVSEDHLTLTFLFTPTENATFGFYDCGGSGTAIIDNVVINGNDIIIVGDLDGDFVCAAADLVIMRRGLLIGSDLNTAYDVNKDGVIDVRDLVRIKKLAASSMTTVKKK